MTTTRIMKYNPAFLDEERLIASFSTRGRDLEAVLEVIREGMEKAKRQILLLIGPRGIGKTTLVLRAAAELRRDPALAGASIRSCSARRATRSTTPPALWLEALFHPRPPDRGDPLAAGLRAAARGDRYGSAADAGPGRAAEF